MEQTRQLMRFLFDTLCIGLVFPALAFASRTGVLAGKQCSRCLPANSPSP